MEVDKVDEAPLLAYMHGKPGFETLYTISGIPPNNDTNFRHDVVNMRGKAILGSCHGWLILWCIDHGALISLYNPTTSQSLHLPLLKDVSNTTKRITCTLTAPPESNINTDPCILYFFCNYKFVFTCRPTQPDCYWVRRRVEIDGKFPTCLDSFTTVISFQGTLYGWFYPRYFFSSTSAEITRDYDDDIVQSAKNLKLTKLQISGEPELDEEIASHKRHHYIECCGRLYCTYVFTKENKENNGYAIVGVQVSELDLQEKKWKEVNCLDGRAFFLSSQGGGSSWCWGGRGGVEQNCVYLYSASASRELDPSVIIYEYSLVDQSFTPMFPCPNSRSEPVWLMPKYRCLFAADNQGLNDNTNVRNRVEEEGSKSKRVRTQLGYSINNNLTDKLPLHVLELIASKYLHLFDYWSFRASCKVFRSAAPPTQSWRTNLEFPSLLFFKNKAGLCSLLDPFRNDSRSSIVQLPLSSGLPFKIAFSNNDWLLILVGDSKTSVLHFFNPLTRVNGKLPPCDTSVCADILVCSDSLGFSTNPTSDDCVTIAIYGFPHSVVFEYFRSADRKWYTCAFSRKQSSITFSPSFNSPIFYQGSFWFIDVWENLGVFTIEADNGQQRSWHIFEKPESVGIELNYNSSFLVERTGKLCSVFIGKIGRGGVKIFEFDVTMEKKWRETEDLGDYVLFISSTFCCSRVTRDVSLRNRIYLPRLKGNGIVYYSLDTRKFHVSGVEEEDTMNDLYYTKEPTKYCWL